MIDPLLLIKKKILTSRIFKAIRLAQTRYIINEGSARSTKTYSLIQYIIYKALEKPRRITIARYKATWVRESAFVDFQDILANQFKIFEPARLNKTEMKYTFPNGSVVSFIGLDEAQKIRGRKQHITWINEANECDYESYRQLSMRTIEQILLDYNPSMEQHWIFEKIEPRPDCTLIHSTYKDNPFLEQAIIDEIESLEPTPENIKNGTADDTLWKIYGLGLRASPKGLIYPEFNIVKSMPSKEDCKKRFYGQDFGFTNDPTALVDIALAHGELWFDELIYKTGLTNIINPKKPNQPSIEAEYRKLKLHTFIHKIWGDSAEPKSIQDLRNCGFNIKAADKGKDSIVNGIDVVKRYRINVTERSLNLIKELQNYKWKEDKDGNSLNEPIDNFNHLMDAIRYGCFMELDRSRGFRASSVKNSDYD